MEGWDVQKPSTPRPPNVQELIAPSPPETNATWTEEGEPVKRDRSYAQTAIEKAS
jgi:hypothetical protein